MPLGGAKKRKTHTQGFHQVTVLLKIIHCISPSLSRKNITFLTIEPGPLTVPPLPTSPGTSAQAEENKPN